MKLGTTLVVGIIIGVVVVCGTIAICGLILFANFLTVPPIPTGRNPTASNGLGQSVLYQNIKTTVIEYEFSTSYTRTHDVKVQPPVGAKFFWLHIVAENAGVVQLALPSPGHVIVLYQGTEISPNGYYSDRPGYQSYDGGIVFPNVSNDGWILFALPLGANASDITVRADLDIKSIFAHAYYYWRLGSP